MSGPEWQSVVPSDVMRRAYRSLNGELAWSRADAMDVVDLLQHRGHRILGIDIWIPTSPGPTIPVPFVYDWAGSGTSTAIEFIKTFEWDEADRSHGGMQPYFNITA